LENIVLADDTVAVGDEIHLWLHGDGRISAAKLAPRRVEDKIFKEIEHFCLARAGSLRMRMQPKYPERQKIKVIVRKYQGPRKAENRRARP